jgi:hypothetical protein
VWSWSSGGRNGRRYDEEDREALIALWEASDRICSKRLKPLIPVLLPALERHGRIRLADDARDRLLAVSETLVQTVCTSSICSSVNAITWRRPSPITPIGTPWWQIGTAR